MSARARERLALVLGVLAAAGAVFPFVGVLGVVAIALHGRRPGAPPVLGAFALTLAVGWGVVFLLPRAPVVVGSPPAVYAVDGAEPRREAALFAGSLFLWAERQDVARLASLRETDGEYRLRLRNESAGTTDRIRSVGLLVVEHDEATEILATQAGALVAIAAPRADVARAGRATIALPRPEGARAVLVLRARTTRFAEEAFFGYLATMGQGMTPFLARVVKDDCETSHCAREVMADELDRLGLPLRVTVAGAIYPVAPVGTAWRTFAVPVVLPPGSGNTVPVQLDHTPDFWEIDELALAAVTGEAPAARELTLRSADVRAPISLASMEQVDLRFEAPPSEPEPKPRQRTFFVAVRGHYDVPFGGRPLIDPAAVLAHRWGLTSLPRFAAEHARD